MPREPPLKLGRTQENVWLSLADHTHDLPVSTAAADMRVRCRILP